MTEGYPVVFEADCSGPMEESDLRRRLRIGRLPRNTRIHFEPWTGSSPLPAFKIGALYDETHSELALLSHRLNNRKSPLFSIALVLVLILSMIVQTRFPRAQEIMSHWGMLGFGSTTLDGHWYAPITSQFIHSNWGHLVVNTLVITYCSIRVEQALGIKSVLQIILGATALGGILVCAFSVYPVVGSSILGFGLWGAQIALGFRYNDGIPKSLRHYYGWGTFLVFTPIYAAGLHNMQVSHLGHLGGLIGGVWITLTGTHGLGKPSSLWSSLGRWGCLIALLLIPSQSFWSVNLSHETYERSDLGLEMKVPSRMVVQNPSEIQLFSAHPNDSAYSFVHSWVLSEPTNDTADTVLAWWEAQFEEPAQIVRFSRLNEGREQRFELKIGEHRVVEHQYVRGRRILRVGYWLHPSAESRRPLLENILSSLKLSRPRSLQELAEQFELLSAVPDVRFDYARELLEWGEIDLAEAVISPLVASPGRWGALAAQMRLKIHFQYPKYFAAENPQWIDDALRQHAGDYPFLYLSALDYVLQREDCLQAEAWLSRMVDEKIKAEAYDKTSVYCSLLEE